jgi:hypothetical protein
MLMGFKLWTFSMRSILINVDPWEWFSEDLEARRGILLRREGMEDVIGYIRSGTRGEVQELREKEVTHLAEAGTKILEELKQPVIVWK